MMNIKRNYIWLLPLLALLLAPLWWRPAGRLLRPRVTAFTPSQEPGQLLNTFVLRRVTMTQSRDGVDELLVKAERVQSGQSADELRMFAVDGQMIGERRTVRVNGGEAEYDSIRQIFTVYDRVRLVTTDGYRLETEVLRYFPRFRKVKTAEMVNLAGPGVQLRGEGMVYDMYSGDFRVGGRVAVDFS
jgi:LPS export ABC transporter protein LptC